MLIFVGTLLGSAEFSTRHKVACVAWCYAGVVISDLVRLHDECHFYVAVSLPYGNCPSSRISG